MSILITLLKNKWFSIISFLKNNFKTIAVTVFMILTAFCYYQHNELIKREAEIDRVYNNYLFYMNQNDSIRDDNRTLLLTIDDYKLTTDSLINEIKETQKKLKIKDKELKLVSMLKQKVQHDTTFIVKSNNFNITIKPNDLTTILVNKKDSLLLHKLIIENTLTLYLLLKRVYRRKYKNWFSRLFHLDFKKRTEYEYEIHNSNDLIDIKDTRLIELHR